MGTETYCILTYANEENQFNAADRGLPWTLDLYSWPTSRVSPRFSVAGFYATAQEAVLAGIAAYGRVYRADAKYDTVWSAAWPQTDRKKALPGEVSAAEEAWRDFVRDLEEVSGENQSASE